ncbi:MAG TPA: branched-chain amino acid aminotransferase [Streptosporangiaceae bacterium]|jgi:branched-chain amino acid aminotransferase
MNELFPLQRSDHPVPAAEREGILASPGFGRYFTDHMVRASWTPGQGWHGHSVTALAPFSLHPGAAVLHYAQEIFEGLKAYRHADESVWLFRPQANARRFVNSSRRLALPELDEQVFVDSLEALVRADAAWVPGYGQETSLYLRPFMFASEAFLGVRPAVEITYAVIASPAGPYFTAGAQGTTLWVSDNYRRAGEGGTGAAKCGGNYASGLAAQVESQQHGCDQVLYVDSAEPRWLEEAGTMNLFLVTASGELVTPGLGTILAGVMRATVLDLAASHGLKAVERQVSLDEMRSGCRDGSVTEVFASGTAAVITPVVAFKGDGYEVQVGDGRPGEVAQGLREHILDIQYGRIPDDHGWMHRVG